MSAWSEISHQYRHCCHSWEGTTTWCVWKWGCLYRPNCNFRRASKDGASKTTLSGTFMGKMMVFPNSPGGLVGYSLDKPLQVPRLKHGTLVMVIHAIMGILRLHYESLGDGLMTIPQYGFIMDLSNPSEIWGCFFWVPVDPLHYTGWWFSLTILKNIIVSWEGLFPIYYGKIKFMFQTTNQLYLFGVYTIFRHPQLIYSVDFSCVSNDMFHCTWYHLMISPMFYPLVN